ncbi:hypothetical protein F5887DRAFT_893081 [Amanita rubescens]|nr:hypothetical protein F5887DRAFT_893081 [Amanita rubescens]
MDRIHVPPDSFTQFGNSSERPNGFPPEILWTFADCKADMTVGTTKDNASRPNMRMAIRSENGKIIKQGVYELIRSSAQMIATSMLLPLLPRIMPKGFRIVHHFQINNSQVWTNAILLLEKQHPLVALCAEHWKAKYTLQSVLRNKKEGLDDAGGEDGEYDAEQPPKRSRVQSPQSPDLSQATAPADRATPTPPRDEDAHPSRGVGDEPFDISYIKVNAAPDNLLYHIKTKFSSLESGIDLLNSMQLAPSFGSGSPSDGFLHFLQVIETADPNSGAFEEDDLGQNWGHAQFSGQWRDVLTKWDDVGSPPMACRLLAAVLKTTQVARVLCRKEEMALSEKGLQPLTYLCDSYFELLTERLWMLWMDAKGVSHLTY